VEALGKAQFAPLKSGPGHNNRLLPQITALPSLSRHDAI